MTGLHIAQSSTIKLALNPTFIQLNTALMYSAPPSAQVWIHGLKDSDIIPAEHCADFITQVFWNIHKIVTVNTRLRDALNKRQKSYAVMDHIGDILLDSVPHFAPFVSYGAHQLYGKYEFEKEKSSNPVFAQFVEVSRFSISLFFLLIDVVLLDYGKIAGIAQA
jgi:hypothetical protein